MITQRYAAQPSGASLIVLENNQVRVFQLDSRNEWKVGRYSPDSANPADILLTSRIVSREHGWLQNIDNRWFFVDNSKNLNGTYHNGTKILRNTRQERVSVPLANGDVLRIDLQQGSNEGAVMLFTTVPTKGTWVTHPLNKKVTVIGRAETCDIVVALPYMSSMHAKVFWRDGNYYLSDCNSRAGTFLNGKAVTDEIVLREKDCFSICDCNYFFLGDRVLYIQHDPEREERELHQTLPAQRPIILRADINTKLVRNNNGSGMKELIRDIHLEIRQGTLVALLGTAGAGKSTIMNCLNGMDLEGVQGSVLYRNVDLMKHFDQMKHMIGCVPQEKIFHPEFTPEQEFRLAAQKRLPADTSRYEIDARVTKTLEMLGITGVRNNKNSKLSGGEKTRVNIGIELVADRDLLCLDEPDQGLDPKYKHEVFQIMRDLAHRNGKSVLSIIHDVSEIDMFDQVIMLVKANGVGRLVFSGTPAEMREKFCVSDIRDVYGILEKEPERYIL